MLLANNTGYKDFCVSSVARRDRDGVWAVSSRGTGNSTRMVDKVTVTLASSVFVKGAVIDTVSESVSRHLVTVTSADTVADDS